MRETKVGYVVYLASPEEGEGYDVSEEEEGPGPPQDEEEEEGGSGPPYVECNFPLCLSFAFPWFVFSSTKNSEWDLHSSWTSVVICIEKKRNTKKRGIFWERQKPALLTPLFAAVISQPQQIPSQTMRLIVCREYGVDGCNKVPLIIKA